MILKIKTVRSEHQTATGEKRVKRTCKGFENECKLVALLVEERAMTSCTRLLHTQI